MTTGRSVPLRRRLAAVLLVAALSPAAAQAQALEDLVAAVVKVKAYVPGDARSAQTLGPQREGSGVLIDQSGLVLTIGYLILEANAAEVTGADGKVHPAQVAAYDHETGFGLLRMLEPPRVKAIPLGSSAALKERDTVVVASFGGREMLAPAIVVGRRPFAGSWEYLLDNAIFTAPPHPAWSGAALLDRDGKLVGIGSLIVGDAMQSGSHFPGNMFVPIDDLKGILADMIADGRAAGPPKPWLGINTEETNGRLFVTRVSPESPAERAGLRRGDIIMGVGGQNVSGLIEFYRQIHARGAAGVSVPLTVLQGAQVKQVTVESADRRSYLKLKSSF